MTDTEKRIAEIESVATGRIPDAESAHAYRFALADCRWLISQLRASQAELSFTRAESLGHKSNADLARDQLAARRAQLAEAVELLAEYSRCCKECEYSSPQECSTCKSRRAFLATVVP